LNVWIVNQYAQPPTHPGGTRHHALGRHLIARGHNVTIVASPLSYLTLDRSDASPESPDTVDGVRYVWVEAPSYADNGLGRLRSMMVFAVKVGMGRRAKALGRPDVVVGSSPHPFAAAAARRVAHRFGVPFILEIRDLWPDSLVDIGRISRRHPFILLLSRLERSLYRSSARVVSLLPSAASVIEARGARTGSVSWIPNGVDLSEVPEPQPRQEHDSFTLTYAGALGRANALDFVIDAAQKLAERGEEVRFRLIGSGTEKGRLEGRVKSLGLHNVLFEPPIPKENIYGALADSDAFLMPLMRGDVFRYGVSPNKLFDYFAAARPVIFAVNASNDPVSAAGAGLRIPSEDASALIGAIRLFRGMTADERWAMGMRGRRYVEESHNLSNLAGRFSQLLMDASKEPRPPAPLKRAMDVVGASLGLALTGVPMCLIACIIRVTMGSPVLFRQLRPGLGGKNFEILKFRTMRAASSLADAPSSDAERLTLIGSLLRRTSLDELPELINVLKGDMSLVGPRPLLPDYLERYTPDQARRHLVRPGITGWAQISGRNALSWAEKFALDVWYVDNWSLGLDFEIMWMTVKEVVSGRGVSARGHATMPPFMGTNETTDA
jgi:lipopolysaccharide/colanic/teichoic acid biosynthesis glycosyltransferase